MKKFKLILIAGILWIGFTASSNSPVFPQFGPDAANAGNGNGGNGGNGGGNGGNSGNNGNGKGNAGGHGIGNSGRSDVGQGHSVAAKSNRQKGPNLSSELKGLNSLNRNLNGLLNSNDPKMDEFRTAVITGEVPVESEEWSEEVTAWVNARLDELIEEYNERIDPENTDSVTDP